MRVGGLSRCQAPRRKYSSRARKRRVTTLLSLKSLGVAACRPSIPPLGSLAVLFLFRCARELGYKILFRPSKPATKRDLADGRHQTTMIGLLMVSEAATASGRQSRSAILVRRCRGGQFGGGYPPTPPLPPPRWGYGDGGSAPPRQATSGAGGATGAPPSQFDVSGGGDLTMGGEEEF